MSLPLEKVKCESLKIEILEKKYRDYLLEMNRREFD
jgi:hypothetical protein